MQRKVVLLSAGIGVLACLAWSRETAKPVGDLEQLRNPAARGSVAPNLSITPDGEIILSWFEPSGQNQALRFSLWNRKTWSVTQTVVRRPDFDVYAEAPPAVLKLANGTLLAVWAQKLKSSGKWDGNYLFAAASADGGKTWSSPVRVHSDTSISEHSFSSIAATGSDRATLIWLDGREYETKHRYRLMSATLNSKGDVKDEKTIDDDTCTCCPTAFVTTPSYGIAAYRGHNSQEIRDIKISRLASGVWGAPCTVRDDNWHFNGCPVNGPALSVNKDRLAVLWFTARDDVPQVEMALSEDLGKTFQPPQILDSLGKESRPVGHAAVSLLDSGTVLAVWLQQGPSEARIVGQYISRDGQRSSLFIVARGSVRELGYPRLERSANEMMVSWGGKTGEAVKTAEIRTSGN